MKSLCKILRHSMRVMILLLVSGMPLKLQAATSTCMIENRAQLGLRGPVRIMVEKQHEEQPFVFFVRREFDERGNLVEMISGTEHGDKLLSGIKSQISHDESCSGARQVSYWVEGDRLQGDVYSTTLYTYDEHGNKVGEAIIGQNGYLDSLVVRTYNNRGDWVTESRYNKNPPAVESKEAEHTYDQEGRGTRRVVTSGDGRKTVELYNDKGLLVETIFYLSGGELESRVVASYDDRDNKQEFMRYGHDGKLDTHVKTSYKYDSKGNWIVKEIRMLIQDGKAADEISRVSRTISYY